MVGLQKRKIQWAISLFLVMLYFSGLTAQAQYGGGTGEPDDPYLIYTAEQMNEIGTKPNDWDKHFKLMADIDLSNFDGTEGRPIFNIIAPDTEPVRWGFQGTPFAGVFDGNAHTISHLTISGERYLGLFGQLETGAKVKDLGVVDVKITGSGSNIGGLVGSNDKGDLIRCYSTGAVSGTSSVGGLVGTNHNGYLTHCYSTSTVRGNSFVGGLVGRNGNSTVINCYSTGEVCGRDYIGGLVGINSSDVTNCYSTGAVCGRDNVGGLVGINSGDVTDCYSTGAVCGSEDVGGLVGSGNRYLVRQSFWDMETSGQAKSAGGIGKTTEQMQTVSTFLYYGWDFVDETENGTEDIWWILEGQDYPRLRELPEGLRTRPLPAFCPNPQDGATDVIRSPILHWIPANPTLQHDIYFGEDEEVVVNAATLSLGIYRSRQPGEVTTYDPGSLEWGKTYYWRIDEVNEADPNSPWMGNVWSFTTADFLLVDDFESYNDLNPDDPESRRIFNTWIDGYGDPNNGSLVGYERPGPWHTLIHSGAQSMPFFYSNTGGAAYAEATMTLVYPRNWTEEGVGVLAMWFHGIAYNLAEPMYVAVANANGPTAVVYHDNPDAARINRWTEWKIDLQEFAGQGVDLTNVETLSIGFGDKTNPQPGGSGLVFFDDIRLYRPAPEPEPMISGRFSKARTIPALRRSLSKMTRRSWMSGLVGLGYGFFLGYSDQRAGHQ